MTAAFRSRKLARIFLSTAFGVALFVGPANAQKQGGSITVGLELDIPGFDPLKVGVFDTSAETAAAAIFDTLTTLDDKGEVQPKLALSWTHSDDFKTWTFKLRPGVKFQDGTPFNAEAAKANFDRQKDPANKCRCAFYIASIHDVQAPDELTLVYNLTDPSVNLPGVLTLQSSNFVMQSPTAWKTKGDDYNRNPVGTGPYILTQFKQGSEVDLVANGNYWGQKASIKNVKILGVPDDSTRVSMLLSGQADIAESVPQPLISRVSQSANYEIRAIPTASTFYLMFNMNLPPFNDVRVRQALNYSIDRSSLVGNLFKQTAEASYQWYVPAYPGFDKAYDPYPYNPGKARALLAQAGYPNGVDAAFYFPIGNGPMDLQSAEALQAQLQQVGFRVSMHGGDPNSVRNAFTLGNESGVLINNYAPPSLDVALLFAYYLTPGSNYSKTAVSPAAVALVQQAVTTADLATREKLYNQAQDIFLGEQSLFAPLWTQVDTWGVAKDVVFNPEPLQAYYMNQMSFK